jgi:hypothetical protein
VGGLFMGDENLNSKPEAKKVNKVAVVFLPISIAFVVLYVLLIILSIAIPLVFYGLAGGAGAGGGYLIAVASHIGGSGAISGSSLGAGITAIGIALIILFVALQLTFLAIKIIKGLCRAIRGTFIKKSPAPKGGN